MRWERLSPYDNTGDSYDRNSSSHVNTGDLSDGDGGTPDITLVIRTMGDGNGGALDSTVDSYDGNLGMHDNTGVSYDWNRGLHD